MNKKNIAVIIGTAAAALVAAVVVAGNLKAGPEHSSKARHGCGQCNAGKATAGEAKTAVPSSAYPLAVCVVSGEALGSMGAPYTFVHQETEVQLCCRSCLNDFHRNPDALLERIRASAHPHG